MYWNFNNFYYWFNIKIEDNDYHLIIVISDNYDMNHSLLLWFINIINEY